MEQSIQGRILDAASRVLQRGGFASDRLMSAIAREAGLTRQPLYKHFGNIEAIRSALVQREVERVVADLAPQLNTIEWNPESITELVATVVETGRSHPLLKVAVRDVPELILPWMTTNAVVSISYAQSLIRPFLEARIDSGALPPIDVDTFLDLAARIVLSLVLTSSGLDVDDPAALRRYLRTAINFVAFLHPAVHTR